MILFFLDYFNKERYKNSSYNFKEKEKNIILKTTKKE